MAWLKFFGLAYVALAIQTAFLPVVFPDWLRPSALIILANVYLLGKPDEWTVLRVWMIGLLGDMTSLSPAGSQAFVFGLYALLIITIRPVLFTETPFAHAVTAVTGVIVISALYLILSKLVANVPMLPYSVVEVIGQALMTAVIAALTAKLFTTARRPSMARR